MPATGPLLQMKGVTRRFDAAGPLVVLDNVSLEVNAGEALAIVGPSGSGKSTLLQIIGTLDRPTSGEVLLDGRNLTELNPNDLAALRNQEIGFVFQAHYLLPQCTVFENVLVPTLALRRARPVIPGRTPEDSVEARATRLLNRVGLGSRMHHFPYQLSGGESQRVAVVRALINQPRLLLADEPTGSLDHASALGLTRLLLEINQEEEGVTVIVVTHSRELASQMFRILELRDGKWKSQ